MISFVWSAKYPFVAGSGGSENYTAGQIHELQRRGIATRLITIGHGEQDGRDEHPDIPFLALDRKEELEKLDDTLVFVTYPLDVKTKRQAYTILHCPPMTCAKPDPLFDIKAAADKQLLTPSRYAAKKWASVLGTRPSKIPTAYPFAEGVFSRVERPAYSGKKTRILFAGRLTPDKGIYTLLAALHMQGMQGLDYELTATTACSHAEEGQVVLKLLEAHPWVNLVPARKTPQAMAELMAEHDIVVMPSTNIFWYEAFGILSVEAQHAGCRVVASNAGGLPETNCGGMVLVNPDDPQALAQGISKAAKLGPLNQLERAFAGTRFTAQQSVDALLNIMARTEKKHETSRLLHKQGSLVREQLHHTFDTITQLGVRLAGDQQLAERKAGRA
jgi:glycosyltransferase involved in cell wall biosynthesis